jgi:hypothetical protein
MIAIPRLSLPSEVKRRGESRAFLLLEISLYWQHEIIHRVGVEFAR